MNWYTKQSSDLFKKASNDAKLCTYEAINAEETISSYLVSEPYIIIICVMASNIADGFIE